MHKIKKSKENYTVIKSTMGKLTDIIGQHAHSLSYPMDSWLEDQLSEADCLDIIYDGSTVGYAGIKEQNLRFFYIMPTHFSHAPEILQRLIEDYSITRLFFMSQDPLLATLVIGWDYEIEKVGCFFSDSGKKVPVDETMSRTAVRSAGKQDISEIRRGAGDFFDEASGGYATLEERLAAETIFILEEEGLALGYGIVELGRICSGVASIGMFVNPAHRRRGAAKTILIALKQWVYNQGLKPVAGCWYYNTLSRKSLESAGMIATAVGYEAILGQKENLPLRTGNPPGELINP